MTTLNQVRQSNASINSYRSDYVAVFVGATSGIGEAASMQVAKQVKNPTIYLVGRNQMTGSKILNELKRLNPDGSFHFIQADVSLLRNVDDACRTIQSKEKEVDLLFMSTGNLKLSRQDTTEGLENNHVLRYYARMRFIYNLLPLLGSSTAPGRVITVLAAGQEGKVQEDNLDLSRSWSFLSAATYAATMNSLAMEHLASQHPSISFVHLFPGIVQTGLINKTFGGIVGPVLKFLSRPFSITLEEIGERSLFISTSAAYPPAHLENTSRAGVPCVGSLNKSAASTGQIGGGSYLLRHDGCDVTNVNLMADYRAKDFPSKIWAHTLETFQRVLDPVE